MFNWLKRYGATLLPTGWILDGIDSLLQTEDTSSQFFNFLNISIACVPKLQIILTSCEYPNIIDNSIEDVLHVNNMANCDIIELAESLLGGALTRREASQLSLICNGSPLITKICGNCVLAGGTSINHLIEKTKHLKNSTFYYFIFKNNLI